MANNKKFILFLVLSLTSFISINYAKAFEYGGFGLRPADVENQVVRKDESGFLYKMQPETSRKDGIMVINNSKADKVLLLYAADSVVSTDGGFACRQFSEDKKQVGSWIKLEKSEVNLKAGSTEIVPFSLSVPKGVDAGEHSGCFFIQEKKEEPKDAEKKGGIQLSVRTGVKVSVIIPGDLVKKLSVKDFSLTKKKSNENQEIIMFRASVSNDGNVSVPTTVNVNVYNSFGIKHKTLGGNYTVLRDDTSVWNFQLPKPFWGGFYTAKLNVSYENVSKDGVKSIISLKGAKKIHFFSTPTPQGFFLELVLLAFVGFCIFLISVWKKRQDWILTWKSYRVARSTNIKVLAEKYDVSWSLLARVNKIKPPYIITAKDEILVPADTEESYSEKARKSSIFTKIQNNFSKEKNKKKTKNKKKK